MVPLPDLMTLLDVVRTDAGSEDSLEQLAQASRTASQLEALGDTLLDHFVDQCRRAGHSWSEISAGLGVSKQAAHKRFSGPSPAFDRFTPRASKVVERSVEQARALGHRYLGTEHVLLALFDSTDSLAARMLAEAGITKAACEEQVLARIPSTEGTRSGQLPITPRAEALLRGAVEESRALGHSYVGTEHLLLALFRDPESLAAKVLTSLGASHQGMREMLTEIMATFTTR